jgi:hypothetical protein
MDSTANAKAAAKGSRRVHDDSYTALRDAAEKRRAQNRIAQRNSREFLQAKVGIFEREDVLY